MIAAETLGYFLLVAIPLQLTPGPAVFLIVTRSVEQGRAAGLASTFGVTTGSLIHVIAAAMGLSAVVAASATAFAALKVVAALYFVFLGIQAFTSGRPDHRAGRTVPKRTLEHYRDGLIVNVFNPKTVLFYLTFPALFVRPEAGSVLLQVLFFGLLFVAMGVVCDVGYALLGQSVGRLLANNRAWMRRQRFVSGVVFLGLGTAAALVEGREPR